MGKCFSSYVVKLYIGYAGVTKLALGATTTSCSGLGSSDTCYLLCSGDSKGSGQSFYCGNAGDCRFECEGKTCASSAKIYGNNANVLRINPTSGDQCLKGATVYAPDSGDLYLNTGSGTKAYREMTIHAGSNTKSIYWDCSGNDGDDCKKSSIYAQNAEYLEITVSGSNSDLIGDTKENDPSDIYCPQNSPYNGASIAPCIIDVSGGGTIDTMNIHTANGIPRDVWINKGSGTISSTRLYCDAGSTTNFFSTTNTCWNTLDPTKEPTVSPTTKEPTSSPTPAPTSIPTAGPTVNPSDSPTFNPSTTPSSQPTEPPTTHKPTSKPTSSPSFTPTLSPTSSPNDNENTENGGGDDEDSEQVRGSTQLSITTLVAIIVISVILCLLCACIVIFIRKLRKSDAEISANVVEMETHFGTSQMQRARKKESDKVLVKEFFSKDVELPIYYELFMKNGYDSMKAISAIRDRAELEEIGVTLYGHQSQILTEIRRLRETDGYGAETGAAGDGMETNETFEFGGGSGEGPGASGVSGFETDVHIQAGYEPDNIDFAAYNANYAQANNMNYAAGYNMNYGANMNMMRNVNMMQMAQQNMAQMYMMNMAQQQQQNMNNYGGQMQHMQRAQNAVNFNDLPPPPPNVDNNLNTKGNDARGGDKQHLINDLISQQKQRIMDLQQGEGGSRTSLTGVGTLESEDLFGQNNAPFEFTRK